MSVYVGKDVTIVIQNPVEEDISSQANGSNAVFTVSKKPISDRDLDGVADEPAHVTVYVNGSPVTVNAVDDDQGQVTLASAPAQGSRVIVEYRYDSNAEVAQEITIEPKQAVEGVDGLGDNKIQEWALLLKEFSGSLKEVFRKTEQLDRLGKKKFDSKYSQQFWSSAALNDFQGDVGSYSVDNQELLVLTSGVIGVKSSVLTAFRDGIIRCKQKRPVGGGDAGWIFRWDGTGNNYCRVFFDGFNRLKIEKVKNGNISYLFASEILTLPSSFFPVEIRFTGNKIVVDVNNGTVFSVVDSDPLLISGMAGFYSYYGNNDRFDDFQIWNESSINEYGLILNYTRETSTVKIGLDGVIFPEGSIPSPKNAPVFLTSSFKAKKIKFIT